MTGFEPWTLVSEVTALPNELQKLPFGIILVSHLNMMPLMSSKCQKSHENFWRGSVVE